ncbi:Fe-S protein assembly co-chaperone HscB [Buchnera aphidicola]|uniref:Fe-S protein assembly co-chaperone HscB n=1 Tax=Buchnera aphidicola TaxID=9 RepID=UPI003464A89F
MDYFKLFNLPQKYTINKFLLTENFYKLQLKFHPDLFTNNSRDEKKIALKKSIEINRGYQILKDSLSRAIYLLSLNGLKISKEKFSAHDQIFLKKYFFLHEELDYLIKHDDKKVKLDILFEKVKKKIQNYEEKIEVEFNKKNWNQVIKLIAGLLFFKKIQDRFKK